MAGELSILTSWHIPLLKEDSMEMILEQAARGKSLLRKQDL